MANENYNLWGLEYIVVFRFSTHFFLIRTLHAPFLGILCFSITEIHYNRISFKFDDRYLFGQCDKSYPIEIYMRGEMTR